MALPIERYSVIASPLIGCDVVGTLLRCWRAVKISAWRGFYQPLHLSCGWQ